MRTLHTHLSLFQHFEDNVAALLRPVVLHTHAATPTPTPSVALGIATIATIATIAATAAAAARSSLAAAAESGERFWFFQFDPAALRMVVGREA